MELIFAIIGFVVYLILISADKRNTKQSVKRYEDIEHSIDWLISRVKPSTRFDLDYNQIVFDNYDDVYNVIEDDLAYAFDGSIPAEYKRRTERDFLSCYWTDILYYANFGLITTENIINGFYLHSLNDIQYEIKMIQRIEKHLRDRGILVKFYVDPHGRKDVNALEDCCGLSVKHESTIFGRDYRRFWD